MPDYEQLMKDALNAIQILERRCADLQKRLDAAEANLAKARGPVNKSAQERLAELQLKERGELGFSIIASAENLGNPWADPRGEAAIANLLSPEARKARKERKRR